MPVINTNVSSLIGQAALNRNNRDLQKVMEQLSTGRRINSASDDAAGLAISQGMTAQIRGLNQAIRNANDGISLIQTAEGATNEVGNMLQRMRELAVQSSNDTYNDGVDRNAMDTEFQGLLQEIDRIANVTKWNGKSIFDAATTFDFQVGFSNTSDDKITIVTTKLKADEFGATGLNLSALSVALKADAQSTLDTIDAALNELNTARASMGGYINRLNFTVDNLSNVATHLSESRSRIQDTDYAQASSELAKRQIISQAATAMLAQANQTPQTVLQLLKQ